MQPPELKETDGVPFLQFAIEHGSYNSLQRKGGRETLLLTEWDFLTAIRETIHLWSQMKFSMYHPAALPSFFSQMSDVLESVAINEEEETGESRVPIFLWGNYVVTGYYNGIRVLVPLETFVSETVSRLTENPTLKIGGLEAETRRKFKATWKRALEEVIIRKSPQV